MMDRARRVFRPKAVTKLDNLVGPLYVKPDELEAAVAELTRMMNDNIDAHAETVAVIGRQLAELSTTVDALQEEVQRLREKL
jgi:hypothetical protein